MQVTINLCNLCVHLPFMTDTSKHPGWVGRHSPQLLNPLVYFDRTLTCFKAVAKIFHHIIMSTVGRVLCRGIMGGGGGGGEGKLCPQTF